MATTLSPCGNNSVTLWQQPCHPVSATLSPCGNNPVTQYQQLRHPVATALSPCGSNNSFTYGLPVCALSGRGKGEEETLTGITTVTSLLINFAPPDSQMEIEPCVVVRATSPADTETSGPLLGTLSMIIARGAS